MVPQPIATGAVAPHLMAETIAWEITILAVLTASKTHPVAGTISETIRYMQVPSKAVEPANN